MRLFSAQALLWAGCYWGAIAVAQATVSSELSPNLESPPEPQPDLTGIQQLNPPPEPAQAIDMLVPRVLPAVPVLMAWIGSIGGLLGIISFSDTYIRKLFDWILGPPSPPTTDTPELIRLLEGLRSLPKKDGEPSWKIAIQVGLDGTGPKGAGGDFPQICLWNRHGELIGYNDQTIRLMDDKWRASAREYAHTYNFEESQKDMPTILSGGFKTLGIWPAPGRENLKDQQATYVTMLKRHFDANVPVPKLACPLIWPTLLL